MKTDIPTSAPIIIESIDGSQYCGANSQEVVTAMRKEAWGGLESDGLRGYMRQVAKRLHDWNGVHIPTRSAREFLKGLVAASIITLRRDNNKEL
jgi:hypothetical protein